MIEEEHRRNSSADQDEQHIMSDALLTLDNQDRLAIVELAMVALNGDGAALSTIMNGQHTVLASKGQHPEAIENSHALIEKVVEYCEPVVAPPEKSDDPFYIGLPIYIGQEHKPINRHNQTPAGVLSIVDFKRSKLSSQDEAVLVNLQTIANSLAERHQVSHIAATRQSELALTLEQMDQGITVFDADARLTLWNKRYLEMFDVEPSLARKGCSLRELIDAQHHKSGFEGFATSDYDTMLQQLRDGLARGETVKGGIRLGNGRIISSIHTAMPDGGWVATHSDITDRVLAQEKAEQASRHDGLTNLANRTKFTEEFELRSHQDGRLVVMLIDIDHFKAVNDNYGHEAGDLVIRSVAQRLQSCVRSTDMVARLGGDEFAILLHLDNDVDTDVAQSIAANVVKRMEEQLTFKGAVIRFSVSIGYCETNTQDLDLESALSRADFALYKAKEAGRAQYQMFDQKKARELRRSKQMRALVNQDTYAQTLKVFYQPIVCLQTGIDYCCEALIRWAGNRSDQMAPSDIIQAAEQNGSINSLGNWVLNQAMKDHKSWNNASRLAINVSPRQLGNGDFAKQVEAALQRWNLTPNHLELEVTETALLNDNASIDELHTIKQMGVQIALDDFGTGYSSLTLLQHFPFDKLKIDRSFVCLVDTDSLSRTIVGSVLALGRELKIETIAEGIETPQHMSVMKSLGCNMGQGYLLGKPMSSANIINRYQASQNVA